MRKLASILSLLLIATIGQLTAENADLIVAQDGSGDYTTIQAALDAAPANATDHFVILIKNGTYNEKIFIEKSFIALVGEDRDSTTIVIQLLRDEWRAEHPSDWGTATVNIADNVTDITLANLTILNNFGSTYPDDPRATAHIMAIRGGGHRVIIVNSLVSAERGGDTVSLWSDGYYYHKDCTFIGGVDFVCPRGWCYIEDTAFYGYNTGASVWHDGDGDPDMKFVIRDSHFDGVQNFGLGRYHREAQFYLLDCLLEPQINDNGGILKAGSDPIYWGTRVYYHETHRDSADDYSWHTDNLFTAEGTPSPDEMTPEWVFRGEWDPESEMPSVLPWAYMPKPDHRTIRNVYEPTLEWIAGRNAVSHNVYFGTSKQPAFQANVTETTFSPGTLQPNTVYYWRVDEVTEEGEVIAGKVWHFRTATDQQPTKVSSPEPVSGAIDVEAPVMKLDWDMEILDTDKIELHFGTDSDNLEMVYTNSVAGYFPGVLALGNTYYWRVDVTNQNGTITGDVWNFSMKPAAFDKADYVQGSDENALVVIEAEQFTNSSVVRNHEWTLVTEPEGFSGKGAMRALPDDGAFYNSKYSERSCQLDFAVNFTSPGTHYLWVRAYSTDGQDNYLHMGLNGEEVYEASRIGNFSETGQWEWIHTALNVGDPRSFEVNAIGVQSVNVWFGRDGITIDKIVLTTNPDYVPTGDEPSTWTSVEERDNTPLPADIQLNQNYPNPFNPETKIDFSLPQTGEVSLAIYDVLGREVETLVSGVKPAGQHKVTWQVKDRQLASGIYTAVLKAGSIHKSIKLLYLK